MPAKFSKRQLIIVGGLFALLLIGYFVLSSNLRIDTRPPEVTLSVWGVFEENAAFQALFEDYRKARPNVTLIYTKIGEANYKEKIVDALASGSGPDLFLLDNRSVWEMREKLAPMPVEHLSYANFQQLFPTVVEQDVVIGQQIYALPIAMDTLVLLYNRTLFDQANLAAPPATWKEFQDYVPYVRKLNESGQIAQAAAAMGGTSLTMPYGTDLLSVLMMQNGVAMTNPAGTRATFASDEDEKGLQAFNYYLQFANSASPLYTWNADQPNARELMRTGKLAMFFGYHSDFVAIKKKNPLLDVVAAPLPQTSREGQSANYASYWNLAVSKQSPRSWWAWDFIAQSAANPSRAKIYAEATKRLPALRTLVSQKYQDRELGVFAQQVLTARSWHIGDPESVASYFDDAVGAVLTGRADSRRALQQAEGRVSQLLGAAQREQEERQ